MATWAIGDLHGCFDTLRHLLARLNLDERRDRLWLVGDLVNRGPRSLEVLRWARATAARLGERMVVLLGNHDLHLLALDRGVTGPRPGDTLEEVLAAPDRRDLLDWLAARPLLHREGDTLLVHAGLLPSWTPAGAERAAREVEAALRAPGLRDRLLARDAAPSDDARRARLRSHLTALTLLRTCTHEGSLCRHNGPPAEAPPGCLPWFHVPGRRSRRATIVFGHWAALGLLVEPRLVALDTGCVWGHRLTAVRLQDHRVVQEEMRDGPAAAD